MRRAGTSAALATVALLLCLGAAPAAGSNWLASSVVQPLRARDLLHELTSGQAGKAGASTPFQPLLYVKAGGYLVAVVGLGESVGVAVERRNGFATTAYVVRGTATRGRLQASFGKLGEVSMRFRPSTVGDRAQPRRSCDGRHHILARRGVYVGSFRFRGEGGYVSVHARRAKGMVREIARPCVRPSESRATASGPAHPSGEAKPERALLSASWRQGISATQFLALEGRQGKNDYVFETETSQGRMAILRSVILFGAGGVFTHDDALTTARVAPPLPFHGAATYRAAPDGTKTWQGKLSVSVPGVARLPLTGSPFEVDFELFSPGFF